MKAPNQQGFTLIESLVALLIVSGGLFGLLATQTMLARNADLSRQRGEAVRLAQERIEALRSFSTIETVAGQLAWNDLAAGDDEVTTNATFTREWTLRGATSDAFREVEVNVSWTDRAGDEQTFRLSTVIAKVDPADVGALGFPLPANTTLKRPKNRDLNIPVPATDLGDGRSVYQVASNFAVIFSNDSGYVVQRCAHVVETVEDIDDSCEDYAAVILAGYVSRTMSSFPATLGVSTAGLTGLDTSRTASCSFGDARNQNTGAILAGFKYYLCILPMLDDGQWSGTLRLSGMNTGTDYRVCRFQYPAAAGTTANQRNVQPYVNVRDSLDSQNYVITTSNSCPTVSGLATTLHQRCIASNAARATECPAS